MHAFLVSTRPTLLSSPYLLEIQPETSIGIEEIRNLQHFISRKPPQNQINTVVIHKAHLLTLPAQNAFLKTLEEPPPSTHIYLVTDFPDQLIPTILSRLQDKTSANSNPSEYSLQSIELFNQLQNAGVGEKLKLLEVKDFSRDTALEFLSDLEIYFHEQLPQIKSDLPRLYDLLSKSRLLLKSNVNIRLALGHFALHL